MLSADQAICIQAQPGAETAGRRLGENPSDFSIPIIIAWEITQNNLGIFHALRIRARRILISRIHSSRLDAERVEDIGLEISIAPAWNRWLQKS